MKSSFTWAFAATVLWASTSFAGKGTFNCRKGQVMAGDIEKNNVYCIKKAKVLKKTPKCGIWRYAQDVVKAVDKCVRPNKPKQIVGDPKCLVPGSVRKVVKGYDKCVRPEKRGKSRYCEKGWTMDGSITALGGRGSVHCQTFGKKKKTPKCGIERYALNRKGDADRCVDPNKPSEVVGKPKCGVAGTGGVLKVLPGYDWCYGRDQVKKPSSKKK